MYTSDMPRIARVVAPGYPHHITQRGTNRFTIFFDDEDRGFFFQCLNEWLKKTDVKAWAYCLMDNHFHLLLAPSDALTLGRCLHGTTFRYAQYFNLKYARTGRLWQNRYFSCPVDKGRYLWAVVRYIERNPVRAKMTYQVEDWKWSSARAHVSGVEDPYLNLFGWLSASERKEYRRFVRDEGSNEEIRKATSTGRPLGDVGFVEQLEELTGRCLKPRRRGRPYKREKK
jgi:putative transposase